MLTSDYECSIKYYKHMACIFQGLLRYYQIKSLVCPRPYPDVLFDTSKIMPLIINY